jgi:hypothetical protein
MAKLLGNGPAARQKKGAASVAASQQQWEWKRRTGDITELAFQLAPALSQGVDIAQPVNGSDATAAI